MGFRFSPRATGLFVAVAVVLMCGHGWAVYYELGPSKDDWGLKYDGNVTLTKEGKVNIQFTLADQGRLKPIHSVHVFALSRPSRDGSRTYLLKQHMPLTPSADGKQSGEVQIEKSLADLAVVRIFSYTVDGQPQRLGVRYYDLPLRKFIKKAPVAGAPRPPGPIALPPVPNATK
jgi:hypothetical protein